MARPRVEHVVRTLVTLAVGGAATIGLVRVWPVEASPGASDTTYVPLAPCRLFDYRPAPDTVGTVSGALVAGTPRLQQVTGDVGDCRGTNAVPAGAVAVALNVTAIAPTANSNLRLYPADLPTKPLVSNINFAAGQRPIANKVDVKLSPDGKIALLNQNGEVYAAGDVVGYYTNATLKQLATPPPTSPPPPAVDPVPHTEQVGTLTFENGPSVAVYGADVAVEQVDGSPVYTVLSVAKRPDGTSVALTRAVAERTVFPTATLTLTGPGSNPALTVTMTDVAIGSLDRDTSDAAGERLTVDFVSASFKTGKTPGPSPAPTIGSVVAASPKIDAPIGALSWGVLVERELGVGGGGDASTLVSDAVVVRQRVDGSVVSWIGALSTGAEVASVTVTDLRPAGGEKLVATGNLVTAVAIEASGMPGSPPTAEVVLAPITVTRSIGKAPGVCWNFAFDAAC
jgi:hypothetical protein